jgi:uncharacterized protein YpmB
MNNKPNQDNPLAHIISKLISIIVILIVAIIGLIILLVLFVPKPKEKIKQEIALSMPDANGNFTEAAKQLALIPKDTTNY